MKAHFGIMFSTSLMSGTETTVFSRTIHGYMSFNEATRTRCIARKALGCCNRSNRSTGHLTVGFVGFEIRLSRNKF